MSLLYCKIEEPMSLRGRDVDIAWNDLDRESIDGPTQFVDSVGLRGTMLGSQASQR